MRLIEKYKTQDNRIDGRFLVKLIMQTKPYNKKLNMIFICIGTAIVMFIVGMIIYTYYKNKDEDTFHMTKQEFANITDDDELIDAVYQWTIKYDPVIHGKQAYNKAPQAVKNIIAVFMLDMEVLNGGFTQFYWNRRHELWINFSKAFADVGLPELASMISASDEVFNSIKHSMPLKSGDLEAFSDWCEGNPLNEFDDLYDADLQDKINTTAIKYIKKNIEFFGD